MSGRKHAGQRGMCECGRVGVRASNNQAVCDRCRRIDGYRWSSEDAATVGKPAPLREGYKDVLRACERFLEGRGLA